MKPTLLWCTSISVRYAHINFLKSVSQFLINCVSGQANWFLVKQWVSYTQKIPWSSLYQHCEENMSMVYPICPWSGECFFGQANVSGAVMSTNI